MKVTNNQTYLFRAAGTYRGEAYIEREADRKLYESIERNQRFPYILAPRQSGKSSLIENVKNKLPYTKYRSIFIDFSTFKPRSLTDYDFFLKEFFSQCISELKINRTINIKYGNFSSGLQVILSEYSERIIFFLDEVDFLIRSEFKNTFFSTLRNVFNKRAQDLQFNRIQFVLVGAARVEELIDDPLRSPFNVGESIKLEDFSPKEIEKLTQYLSRLEVFPQESVSKRIYYYTSGSVYLTHLIFEQIWNQLTTNNTKCHLSADFVDKVVNNIINTCTHNIHFTYLYKQYQNSKLIHENLLKLLRSEYLNEDNWNALEYHGVLRKILLSESDIPFKNIIYERVFGNGGHLDVINAFPSELAQLLKQRRLRKKNFFDYYSSCIVRWSQLRYALDKRFVQLTLLLDQGPDTQGPRWQAGRQFQELHEVLDETPEQAIVLLGPPGSGKSTLLRHFELDNAQAVLADAATQEPTRAPLTFFIQLNEYKQRQPNEPLPLPRDWLAERWQKANPDLPSLETLLQERRLTLLLDALNEMLSGGDDPIYCWKEFLLELARDFPGNRVIFSCRSLDYSASLSSKELPVQQVRIELLSDDQVQHFLALYCPEHAAVLWRNLKDTPQLALLRLPYFLKLLVEQTVGGEVPEGRAALLTGFVRQALKREIMGDHPLFQPNVLLHTWDYKRLVQARRWKTPYELPSRGILFPSLGKLAFEMQIRRPEREASQVRIDYDAALAILNSERDRDILKAGEALGVLEEDLDRDEVLFVHQLLQEYFAGRRLADAPDPRLVQVDWRIETVKPSLQETLAGLADADPLPLLPGTGWEETTVMAAAMSAQPDAFVASLMEVNLPLAGRCAAQPDVRISADLKDRIRRALVERTQDLKADLRARIMAGLELGGLGDPRFERRQGPHGDYLLPPLVVIPGGTYPVGSDEGHYADESPVHKVELAPFQIGKFPVTNAEWALFMQAGGYEDERWWETAAAQAWRRGEGTAEGPKQQWRENRKWIQDNLDRLHKYSLTSEDIKRWREYAQMSDEEFEQLLEDWYLPGRQIQPAFWNNEAFNNLVQPVVGICWYEARAYCAWLSAQTGLAFRLPTEVEWEAAARGQAGRRYAYGDDFNIARCNAFETHIRRTTPIGVFLGGETPEGLVDMTGNAWDWTGSLYQPYPYNAGDGREDPATDSRRVVRGGAWFDTFLYARATYRLHLHPDSRIDYLGLRVVVGLSPISEH